MTTEGEYDAPREPLTDRVLGHLTRSLPPDAPAPGDAAILARSVDAVLARRTGIVRIPRRVSAARRWVPLAAAASLLVAAVAMASLFATRTPPTTSSVTAPTTRPTTAPLASSVETAAPSTSGASSVTDGIPSIDVTSLPTAAPPVPSAASSGAASALSAHSDDRTAAQLFTQANDARRRRDVTNARALYLELQSKYPRSAEAVTSFVTLGRLELDSARAGAALAQFDRYLAGGAHDLREDALAGRASALESMGRENDEKRAWQALLSEYPSSLFAPHARTRSSRLP